MAGPLLERALGLIHRHPRPLGAAAVVLWLGFAVVAFGVAPLAPDAANLPQQVVREDRTPDTLLDQEHALALHSWRLFRSDITRSSDTADTLLPRLGVDDPVATAFVRSDPIARKLLTGRSGKMVSVETDETGALQQLVARYPAEDSARFDTHFTRLVISRLPSMSFRAAWAVVPLVARVRLGSGTVVSSLFTATDEAGLPDVIASRMTEIFSGEIDFHHELRPGDRFSVIYESMEADGEPIAWSQRAGRVLAAAFVNRGRSVNAVWFQDPATRRGRYYTLDGDSLQRMFLASPMAFSRVTSGFSLRFHPILKKWRQHLGVDYGAPSGTPVRAVGDGAVEFAGVQDGYGNVVFIRHRGSQLTVYAHLSRIQVRQGARVEQGQRIGAVGSSGWATGPHLHFEFRHNGVHRNPMKVDRASESTPVSAAARPRFDLLAAQMQQQLALAASVTLTRAD